MRSIPVISGSELEPLRTISSSRYNGACSEGLYRNNATGIAKIRKNRTPAFISRSKVSTIEKGKQKGRGGMPRPSLFGNTEPVSESAESDHHWRPPQVPQFGRQK